MGNDQSYRAPVIGYKDTYVVFERKMFAESKSRRVYLGAFHGDHRVEGKRCVVKVNKEPYSYEYAWQLDSRTYEKADKMAKLFNEKYQTSKPIEFVKPEFTSIDPSVASDFLGFKPYGPSKNVPKRVTVAVERFIDGNYEKFVSNVGIMSPKPMATPAAFCHFTYHKTDGEILVCDIQGVRTRTAYILTDPSVHNCGTVLQLYGPSDLGKFGIMKFFDSHTCNSMCQGLKKPNVGACTRGELREFTDAVNQIPKGSLATVQITDCCIPISKAKELQTKVVVEPTIMT